MTRAYDLMTQLRSAEDVRYLSSQYHAIVDPLIAEMHRETGWSKGAITATIRQERVEPVSERAVP